MLSRSLAALAAALAAVSVASAATPALPLKIGALAPTVLVNGVPVGTVQTQAAGSLQVDTSGSSVQVGTSHVGALQATGAVSAASVTTPSLLPDQISHGATGTAFGGYTQLTTDQGSVLCQAPENGQLTSAAGICLQYTPSLQQVGGAAAIFGLQGPMTDYTSPNLIVAVAAAAGATSVTVTSDPSLNNLSVYPGTGNATASTVTSNVSGAVPAGTYFVPPNVGIAFVPGPTTTVLPLSNALAAALPAGSILTFVTPTANQQFTALAGSADMTSHQTTGQAWAANLIVQAEPGSSGHINGLEIDAANFSANTGGFGVWLGNNGTTNMKAGYYIGPGVNGGSWQFGLWSNAATQSDIQGNSLATTFLADGGVHLDGMALSGTYSAWAILDHSPAAGLTANQANVFGVTPVGGMIDNSLQYVGAATGGTVAATNGSTGEGLVCSGTLASYTVSLPSAPLRNQRFDVVSECNITALTVGSVTYSNITALTPVKLLYDGDRSLWVAAGYVPTSTLPYALTVPGLTNTGNEGISGSLTATGNITGVTTYGTQGVYVGNAGGVSAGNANALFGWNCSSGSGEACIVNQGSSVPSGLSFVVWQETTANTKAAAVATLSVSKAGDLIAARTLQAASFLKSALPTGCLAGQNLYVSDGRNVGEAAGAGTGTMAFCNKNALWLAFSTGVAVTN